MRPGKAILWTGVGVVGITFIARRVAPVGKVWPIK